MSLPRNTGMMANHLSILFARYRWLADVHSTSEQADVHRNAIATERQLIKDELSALDAAGFSKEVIWK